MAESKLGIGKDTVPSDVFYNTKLLESDNTFVTGRRAYAILISTGRGLCGAKPGIIESPNVRTQSYESILSGPRLVPPPSLTSVDFSNDGANDIVDAYLWKATVNFTCYSPEQFEGLDKAFFQHFNEVELTLGWENGNGNVSIVGKITDYQFTINEKLHFDCSVTFAGSHVESAAGLSQLNNYEVTHQSEVGAKKFRATALGGVLKMSAKGSIKGEPKEGEILGNTRTDNTPGSYAAVKVKETGDQGLIQSLIPDFIYTPNTTLYFVSLTKILNVINNSIQSALKNSTNTTAKDFEGFRYYLPDVTKQKLKNEYAKSANPYVVLNQFGINTATYAAIIDGRVSREGGLHFSLGELNDFFISVGEIEKIEGEIRVDKYENPHQVKASLIQILTKILGRINEAMGNLIDLQIIPYNQSGDHEDYTSKYGYEITDRKTCIKKSVSPTKLDILDRSCLVRNISIQSTIDSEIASVALASAQNTGDGGKSNIMRVGIFGCDDKISSPSAPSMKEELNRAAENYGAKPSQNITQERTLSDGTVLTVVVGSTAAVDATANYTAISPTQTQIAGGYGVDVKKQESWFTTFGKLALDLNLPGSIGLGTYLIALGAEETKTKNPNDNQKSVNLSTDANGNLITTPSDEATPTIELTAEEKQKTSKEILDEIYSVFTGSPTDDAELITEAINETKKLWAKEPGNISGYKYGVSVTLTVDGYPQHLFGKTFTLSRGLPSMLTKNNVYFVVLKQSHKYSNGDWTMDLEGQMMFDLDGNTPTGGSGGSSGGSSGGGTSSSNSPFWRGSSELSQGVSKSMLADILKGLGISSPNQSQISFMVKWRQVEAAKAAWNPFNTTYDMSDGPNGSPSLTFNDHKVKNYSTKENGIRATINTLTTGRYVQYGYDKIVSAIKAIKSDADIDNAMRAVNNSKWGTKFTLPHTTYKTFNNFIWQGPIIKR